MNAAEARKFSNDNVPKLIEKNFKEAVSNINQKIRRAAQDGEFTTAAIISTKEKYMEKVISELEQHFSDEGYKVEIAKLHFSSWVYVSWQK